MARVIAAHPAFAAPLRCDVAGALNRASTAGRLQRWLQRRRAARIRRALWRSARVLQEQRYRLERRCGVAILVVGPSVVAWRAFA